MKRILSPWLSLVCLAPLAAGCAVQANVAPPPVSATVDVNGQAAVPAVDANANVTADAPQTDSYDETDPAALTDFHQTLDSHGQWVEDPTYGTVWVPNSAEVGPDYTPYSTAGHWAYDDNNDYVWVSDYDWGWAPYHYGRWVEIDGRGWSWIPGRTYRGAWVTWGADDGYGTVGWAPMPPEYVWRGGVAVSYTYSGPSRWSYVGRGDVFSANVGTHVLRGSAAAAVSGHVHATPGGGVGHSGGPPPEKLGVAASSVPHVSPSANVSIQKAQQFAHPSTATALGAHPATHVSSGATMPTAGRAGLPAGASPATGGVHGGPLPTAGAAGGVTPGTGMVHGGPLPTAGTTPTGHGQVEVSHAGETHLPTHTTPVTLPQAQQGRKKPEDNQTAPKKGPPAQGSGHGGGTGGGGGTAGHSGPPKQK